MQTVRVSDGARVYPLNDLGSVADVAKCYNVNASTVATWASRRADSPRPVGIIAGMRVYCISDWADYEPLVEMLRAS